MEAASAENPTYGYKAERFWQERVFADVVFRGVREDRPLAAPPHPCNGSAMARVEDIPQPTRDVVQNLPCPVFDTTPFVSGPPLTDRRVAILSSAALIRRGDAPFPFGSGECRFLPADIPAGDLLISHVSINFDRTGWQRDINVVYPIDRLRELAAAGVISGVAETHYTVMGSTDPAEMLAALDQIEGQLRQERIDSILLSPV
jgi:D-proline reductase (dithiol) PrdB